MDFLETGDYEQEPVVTQEPVVQPIIKPQIKPQIIPSRPSPNNKKNLIIGLSVTAAILVITGIVLAVVFTLPKAAVKTVTPTATVIPTPTKNQTLLLKDAAGDCYEFQKLSSSNFLTATNPCTTSAYWSYDPDMKILSFVAPNFQYCISLPTTSSSGNPIAGGNTTCNSVTVSGGIITVNGIQLKSDDTITAASVGLCINILNGSLIWGNCSAPYTFVVQPIVL